MARLLRVSSPISSVGRETARFGRPSLVLPSSITGTRSAGRRYSTLYQDYFDRLPRFLLNTPETKLTYLKNGLQIASERVLGETCTVGVWINAGSAYETAVNNGCAHFLEHLAFKGTERRSQRDIEIEMENSGGMLNAYTSREQTVYYARVFKQDLPRAVDLIADILQNSKLSEEAIEREKDTILREAAEVDSNEEEVVFEHLHSVAYQGTSHGFPILGPENNIRNMRRELLQEYIQRHYTAPRMVLVAAGNVDHQQLHELAEKHFGGLSDQLHGPASLHPRFTGAGVVIRNDDMPKAHIAIAWEGVGWANPDYFVFLVMQTLVGAWDKAVGGGNNLVSRLAELVADEGLGDSFTTFNTPYQNTGLFGIYGTTEQGKCEDFVHALVTEFVRLARGVSEKEVERARNKLKSTILMQLDGTPAICEDIGRQVLVLTRRMPPAEIFMRIDMVTADEVKRVAEEYLYDNEVAYAAMGPVADFPDYNFIRGWTYSNLL